MNIKKMNLSVFIFLSLMTTLSYTRPQMEFPQVPGVHRMTLNEADGKTIRYVISIPSSYGKSKKTPLVMTLHYGGRVTPYYGQSYLNILTGPALKDLGAIIVSPDCPGKGWTDPYSEKTIISLLDLIQEKYNIDNKRILLTGFSMGGVGTWHIAANHANRFTVILPISSMSRIKTLKKIKNLPIYIIHSKKDEIFHFEKVEAMAKQLKAQGLLVKFVALEKTSHYHTNKFVPALKDAVPWIKKNWK